jgi:hypothetical protein
MLTSDRFSKAVWLMAALAWSACVCSRAPAYVPPAPFLLQQMREALGQADAAVVRQVVSVLTGGKQPAGVELDETVKLEFPDCFRSDIDTPSVRRVHVVCGERSLTAVNGRIAAEPEDRYDRYKDIFLDQSGAAPGSRLATLGVDLAVTSPGRWEGRPVYVVGARYPDMSVTQIWLDKETFRPLRWVIPPTAGTREAGVLDIRYNRWRRVAALWYPEDIHFYVDSRPVRRIRVAGIDIVSGFEAALFDIDLLTASLEAPLPDRNRRPDVIKEVKDAIKDFRRLYE